MTALDHIGSIRSIAAPRADVYFGFGLVAKGEFVASMLRDNLASHHILIADERVHRIYGRRLAALLRAAGVDLKVCLVPSVESAKSIDVYLRLVEQTLAFGVDKGSHVITLGGGVVSNVGGFVAATVYRGLPLIHLPSSLMAQLDACIDVRQAINHRYGKNLIGALYAPRAVIVDPTLLTTLPIRHLRSGIAEAVKHALTQSRAFYRYLLAKAGNLRENEFLERVVRETIK
jgi:3-dehydroquinate synthase